MKKDPQEDLIYLTTVETVSYGGMAKRLKEAGIPFDWQDEPLHAYDPGNFGHKRIYVAKSYIEEAKRLLGIEVKQVVAEVKDELVTKSKNPVYRILRWLALLSLLTPLIGYLLVYLLRKGWI